MQLPDTLGVNRRPAAPPRRADARAELDKLPSIRRSQTPMTDAPVEALSPLPRGTGALHAELRAERDRPRRGRRGARPTDRLLKGGWALDVRLRCDARAPSAARIVVAQGLRDRVAAGALDSTLLLVSELVTNSVRHSGAGSEDAVIVRVEFTDTMIRLEVEDAGRGGGVIAPRPPDPEAGGGFGLQLVQTLSERWGLERLTAGGTLVWAQFPRTTPSAPTTSDPPADPGPARPALTPINQRAGGPRATPAGRTP